MADKHSCNRESTCKWCGKTYLKKEKGQRYCSDKCRKESRSMQSRRKSHKYYHKWKHLMSEKQRYGLGSGKLGPHSYKDFSREEKAVKRELFRLKIKK